MKALAMWVSVVVLAVATYQHHVETKRILEQSCHDFWVDGCAEYGVQKP